MKCKECNSVIKASDKYCANCGAEISLQNSASEYVVCENCHHQNLRTDRFCSHCGRQLETRPHSRKKRKQIAKGKKIAVKQQKSTFSKTSLVTLGIVIIFVVYAVIVFNNSKEKQPENSVMEFKSENLPLEASVLAVASKFNCSCGSCGTTPLETCSCPTATAEHKFIRNELRKGNDAESVVKSVMRVYGHPKSKFVPADSAEVSS